MKNIFNVGLLATFSLLLVYACAPQEFDDHELGSPVAQSELDFSTTPTANANVIEFENSSSRAGIAVWNFGNGNTGKGDKVEAKYPSKGTYQVAMTLATDGGYEVITDDVVIVEDDYSLLDPELEALVRDSNGKDWVFDGGPLPDGRAWYYMADPANWQAVWWNAGGDCCPPPDVSGRMHFDIVGGSNYLYYASPDAEPVVGTFVLDLTEMTLKLNDANILGYISHEDIRTGSTDNVYQVKEITEDRLVLFTPSAGYDTGWVFVFKAVE